MGLTLTIAIIATCVLLIALSYVRSGDTLHPGLPLGGLLVFLYGYLPFTLETTGGLIGYLTPDQFELAQTVNLAGVLGMSLGILYGARQGKRPGPPIARPPHVVVVPRLINGVIVMGGLAVLGFLVGVAEVGGFTAAYGRSYGGGYTASGYVRDLMLWSLPALITLLLLPAALRPLFVRWSVIGVLMSPLAIHAMLGARRGPTFMLVSAFALSYYFARARRPRLLTLAAGGLALGVFVLFLVANRDRIYLGSEEALDEQPTRILEPSGGNEFIYGAGTIVHYNTTGAFAWGGRYFTILFIRPIPRAIWPTKYEDAAEWFNMPSLELNLGADFRSFRHTLGWEGTIGAAPGLIADLWQELWWGGVFALFLIGWVHGKLWRQAIDRGGVYVILYITLLSLSTYLIMQTLEAAIYRFLYMAVPVLVVWRLARSQANPFQAKATVETGATVARPGFGT